MKNLIIICLSTLCYLQTIAQNGVYVYPVKYENSQDVLIKIKSPYPGVYIQLENQAEMLELVDGQILLTSLPLEAELSFSLHLPHVDSAIIRYSSSSVNGDVLNLDLPLYKALSKWATLKEQNQKLSVLLASLVFQENIEKEEVLFFAQQYLNESILFNRNESINSNILAAFQSYKSTEKASGCACIQLNHEGHIAPIDPNGGNAGNGYTYLDNSGQFSAVSNLVTSFESHSPKWHRWYTNEKGPAHEMFLRQYDSGGSFNYEWSSLSQNNTGTYAPNPNDASLLFNFFCSEVAEELPDECDCTKQLSILYRYDANFKVIASKLKPTAKVHSVAQEISTITYAKNSGQSDLIDAGMAIYQTKCNGSFNFDFIRNWFDLAGEVLGLVIDVQDTTQGSVPQDILNNLGGIADALEAIFTTSPIVVTGDCTPKYGKQSLMAGSKIIELNANDPVVVTLSSFTFLGTYGKKKWDNYAKTSSNFWVQGFVESGSQEGHDHCCSDKVTRFLEASVNGPYSEADLVNWIEAWVKLYAPWDNFVQVGDFPIINRRTNRGYFVYDDPDRDCFPASPKSLNTETEVSLRSFDNSLIAGTPSELSIAEETQPTSINSALGIKVYPNPCNEELNIEMSNCKGQYIEVSLYNPLGQELIQLLNETAQVDKLSIHWLDNQHKLVSGTYFVVAKQNGKVFSATPIQIVK